MPATTLRYRRMTSIGLASNAINLSSSGAMGHRVRVPMSIADLNSFFRWARYPGAPRAIGHFNAAGASAVGGPTFLNALEASLGLSFSDLDENVSGLNFKSSILDSSADSRLRSDGAITANDWVMAYVLFKCFGSSSYVTNDVIYNLEDAQNMLTNQGVASAVQSSLEVDEVSGAGGYIDTMFTHLLAADPMRFFDASGKQQSGLFETNPDASGAGSWNIVTNDVIEIPLQFTFAAPVTVSSVGDTAGELSGNTDPTVMVKEGETFNIRLQLIAVPSADASTAARLAAEAAARQADILATAQAVVAAAATAVAAARTAYNVAAAAATDAASKAAIANTDAARGYATHAAGRAAAALAALNALIALQGGGTTNAAELATLADAAAATAAAALAAAASNVAAAQAAYNTAAAAAAQAVIDNAAAGTQVAADALADAQAKAAAALASLMSLQLTAVTAANNAAAAAAAAHLSHLAAVAADQEAIAAEAAALAATSAAEAQAAADAAAADAATAATAAASASTSSSSSAASAAEAAAIDAAQTAASAASAAAAAVSAAAAAAAAADAATRASSAAAAALAFSTPTAATDLGIAGNATIQCSWTNVASSNPVTGISVLLYKAADNTLVATRQLPPSASSYTFTQANTSLPLGISYYFKVQTTNSSGSRTSGGSPVSNALTALVYTSMQTLAGSGTSGNVDAVGTNARFSSTFGDAIIDRTSTYIYMCIVEELTSYMCIRRYCISTGMVSTYFTIPQTILGIINMCIDVSDNIYLATATAIYKLDTTPSISILAGTYNVNGAGETQNDGVGTNAGFYMIKSIDIDPSTNILYVTDGILSTDGVIDALRSIQPDGTVTTIAGNLSFPPELVQNAIISNANGSSIILPVWSCIVGIKNTMIYILSYVKCDGGGGGVTALSSFSINTHNLTVLSNPTPYSQPLLTTRVGVVYTAPFPYAIGNKIETLHASNVNGNIYLEGLQFMFNPDTNTIVGISGSSHINESLRTAAVDSSGGIYVFGGLFPNIRYRLNYYAPST